MINQDSTIERAIRWQHTDWLAPELAASAMRSAETELRARVSRGEFADEASVRACDAWLEFDFALVLFWRSVHALAPQGEAQ